jgi:hypothetical protein
MRRWQWWRWRWKWGSLNDCVGGRGGDDDGRRGVMYYGWGEYLDNGRGLLLYDSLKRR